MLHHVALAKFPQEVLVVGDDNELEVGVIPALIDDAVGHARERPCSPRHVVRETTYSTRLAASASMFSVSSAFVGSSRARMPQFWPKESASASRMMIDASIFWPAEQRPRMSIST